MFHECRARRFADVVTGKLDVRHAAVALPEVDPLAADDEANVCFAAGDEHAFNDENTASEVAG